MTKYVYLFSEGNASMRNLLGGKGANLAEMTNLGLPIPQGFTVTTEACTKYYEEGKQISKDIEEEISKAEKAICVLGGKVINIKTFNLPKTDILRNIVIIKKIKQTPLKYPRKSGVPSKKPIE